MFKNLLDKFRKDKLPPILVTQLMDAYVREPVSFVRGDGLRLWDVDGTEYLDATSGGGATLLGHSYPQISESISLQADKLLAISNRYHSQEQADLAAEFCRIAGMDKVLLCSDHDAARQAAIEIIAVHSMRKNIQHPKILTLGGAKSAHAAVDLELIEFDDLNAVGKWVDDDSVVAILLPSLHCAAGIEFCDADYLTGLRALCDEHNWLLVVDESLTGLGRSGRWFAFEHADIVPDILFGVTALANGIPLGVCAARGGIAETLKPGDYQSYFGGNPLACQVASTVLNVIESEGMIQKAEELGDVLKRKLQQTIGTIEGVVDIRGKGLMIVVELETLVADFATRCLYEGLLVEVVDRGNAIRLMPALTMTENDAQQIVDKLHNVLLAGSK